MLRYQTAGESHGKALVALVTGFPAGVALSVEPIDAELRRRQGGYGRGDRQKLETDQVDFLSGLWQGTSIGSPITLMVPNHDYKIETMEDLPRPRPGHGDLTGSIKYLGSVRGVLERASARETTVRVAAGAGEATLAPPLAFRRSGMWCRSAGSQPRLDQARLSNSGPYATVASCIPSIQPRSADQGVDRRGQGPRRHARRYHRNPRRGAPLRPRIPRPMGNQA